MDGAIALIRGAPGTSVRITLRTGGKDRELSIERRPLASR